MIVIPLTTVGEALRVYFTSNKAGKIIVFEAFCDQKKKWHFIVCLTKTD